MVHIREYLLSVTAAALLCGILRSLAGEKGSTGGLLKLISGIFLALTVVRPLAGIQIREFTLLADEVLQEADAAAQEGADYAQRAMARHISQKTEAYILDKARLYGVQITAEVAVSDDQTPIPVGCTIRGNISPYAKQQLTQWIAEELGIGKEDQQWIFEAN